MSCAVLSMYIESAKKQRKMAIKRKGKGKNTAAKKAKSLKLAPKSKPPDEDQLWVSHGTCVTAVLCVFCISAE